MRRAVTAKKTVHRRKWSAVTTKNLLSHKILQLLLSHMQWASRSWACAVLDALQADNVRCRGRAHGPGHFFGDTDQVCLILGEVAPLSHGAAEHVRHCSCQGTSASQVPSVATSLYDVVFHSSALIRTCRRCLVRDARSLSCEMLPRNSIRRRSPF